MIRRIVGPSSVLTSTNGFILWLTDCRNAGTDSDISCVVYGDGGDTGIQKLDNSKNNMERGQVSARGGGAQPSCECAFGGSRAPWLVGAALF